MGGDLKVAPAGKAPTLSDRGAGAILTARTLTAFRS